MFVGRQDCLQKMWVGKQTYNLLSRSLHSGYTTLLPTFSGAGRWEVAERLDEFFREKVKKRKKTWREGEGGECGGSGL